MMTASDWQAPPQLMNGTSFWYFATDQWRSDEIDVKDLASPLREPRYRFSGDYNVLAARLGWLPAYPTFDKPGAAIVADAKAAGAADDEGIKGYLVDQLKSKRIGFAYADPDAPENWPRNLVAWRANLLGSSAKGSEYFFKYLLGAQNNIVEDEHRAVEPEEIKVRPEVLEGKLDLMVSLDFRMTTTPLYSDIVLPTATWYEKVDISSTDMHPFIHPFSEAVKPGWESRSDWDIFRTLAAAVSDVAREAGLQPLDDIVATPLMHDAPAELAQAEGKVRDWARGECEPIPGKTMPNLAHVVRDYTTTYDKYIALGPNVSKTMAQRGFSWSTEQAYREVADRNGVIKDKGLISCGLPSVKEAEHAVDAVLHMSTTSNGKLAVAAFEGLEKISGLDNLSDLARGKEDIAVTYRQTQVQPAEVITTPAFTGSNTGRRFTPFTMNVEEKLPFRTVTGRQSYYLDHDMMQELGEALATYKPILTYKPLKMAHQADGPEITLKYLTPHNKWSTHSMYFDSQQLLQLYRGGQTVLMNEDDCAAIGVADNDWIEVFNRNGAVATRVASTSRLPRGTLYMYHAQDKHIYVPGVNVLEGTRGTGHNGPTHIHVKPTHMIGGYGQLSYGFNYYGTTGNQRDLLVVVRKLKEADWLED